MKITRVEPIFVGIPYDHGAPKPERHGMGAWETQPILFMKVETDTPLKHRGLNARRIAGTGTDEGDVVRFHALAVDPGGKAAIIMVLVYGAPGAFEKGRASELTEHILNSFHPV